jgi:hypothetical protein
LLRDWDHERRTHAFSLRAGDPKDAECRNFERYTEVHYPGVQRDEGSALRDQCSGIAKTKLAYKVANMSWPSKWPIEIGLAIIKISVSADYGHIRK